MSPAGGSGPKRWQASSGAVGAGEQEQAVLAEELDGTARAGLWPKLVAQYPSIGEYQARTTRQIPVVMLTRRD